jgi:hypothetical protein
MKDLIQPIAIEKSLFLLFASVAKYISLPRCFPALINYFIRPRTLSVCCRDSWVSIATRYGFYVPGIESQLGTSFSLPSRPGRRLPRLLYNWYPSLLVVRWPGHGAEHTTPFWRLVFIYVYHPSVPAHACHGVTFNFTLWSTNTFYFGLLPQWLQIYCNN